MSTLQAPFLSAYRLLECLSHIPEHLPEPLSQKRLRNMPLFSLDYYRSTELSQVGAISVELRSVPFGLYTRTSGTRRGYGTLEKVEDRRSDGSFHQVQVQALYQSLCQPLCTCTSTGHIEAPQHHLVESSCCHHDSRIQCTWTPLLVPVL